MYKLLHTRLFQQHIWSVFMKDNSCNCYMYNTKVVFVIFLEYMDILFCIHMCKTSSLLATIGK